MSHAAPAIDELSQNLPEEFDWSQLKRRELMFVLYYAALNENGARAALAAGYAETTAYKQAGSWIGKSRETSKKPHLYDAYQALISEKMQELWIDAGALLEKALKMLEPTPLDFLEDREGVLDVKSPADIPPEKWEGVREFSIVPGKFGKIKKISMWDRPRLAIELIKLNNQAPEKFLHEHSGPDGGPIQHAVPQVVKEHLDRAYD